MRSLALLALLALLAPPAQAASTMHTHLDWTAGSFEAGLAGAGKHLFPDDQLAPDHERIPVPVNPCHRELYLDLDYEPRNASARLSADGYAAEASMPYRFQAGLVHPNGTVLHRVPIDEPDRTIPFGTAPEAGTYTLELEMREGALVDWETRLRGFAVDDPSCDVWLNEVETDPGQGGDWVELYNEGEGPVEVSGWTVEANRTGSEHGLPNGTVLEPDEHRLVDLAAGTLAPSEETVTLAGPTGAALDVSAKLTDEHADERTWQKQADGLGSWIFAPGTPGEPNAE